ncbi:hypothetical protein K6959_08100 [Bacillus aquiflavi]|uniref:hypothetical protein n=1 Tax=Bacillus aquiflavi TaxID=2672567 RepID=UPI001CA7E85D|nr:hypothetical protein [Bacillus aquiflavi]UAC49741.1 hypothetical protein K6959_08100 [Bacillus aquiflavi]
MTILKNSIASISEELKDDYEKALAFVQEKQAKNKAAIFQLMKKGIGLLYMNINYSKINLQTKN